MQYRDRASLLLGGVRGRRMLLEYALSGERATASERDEGSLGEAVFWAANALGSSKQRASATVGTSSGRAQRPDMGPDEVAARIARADLRRPSADLLHRTLADTAAHARAWQEPDGEDRLLASSVVTRALRRVAEVVCDAAESAWWWTPLNPDDQRSVQWDDLPPRPIRADLDAELHATSDAARAVVGHADERGGTWWSHPGSAVPASTRALSNGSPAGLWFVEDELGWDRAASVDVIVPSGVNVFEIADAASWAELCMRFPLDVTAQKRSNWRLATDVAGRWVAPDWAAVAEHYDGVHLQVGAYLAVAGMAIPAEETGAATVIAGWNPDETYWFTSCIAYGALEQNWLRTDVDGELAWSLR